MRVMSDVTDPVGRMHTMTKSEVKAETIDIKELLERDEDFMRAAMQALVQAALEAEMTAAVGAEKSERTAERLSYRSGYYGRTLVTRIGTLELRVPQDRAGRFSTKLFERYQRSEKALGRGAGRDVRAGRFDAQELAPAKAGVKAVTEALCGHSFSASAVSARSTPRSMRA
jgi:putative transposase